MGCVTQGAECKKQHERKQATKREASNKICKLWETKVLEYANSKKIGSVIFVGEKEVTSGKFKIKDMKSGGERLLK